MSNAAVGAIYAQVIDRIIAAAQNDFEEYGIDQQTLQDVKRVWQEKTSALRPAQLPWDPPPAPPQIVNPPTLPSNVTKQGNDSPVPAAASLPQPGLANNGYGGGPRIKTEYGYENNPIAYPPIPYSGPQGLNTQVAQQRAAAILQQQYGNQASASIAAAGVTPLPISQQSGLALPGQQRPTGLQLPGQQQQQSRMSPQQFQQQQQQRNSLPASQTDGAGDAAEEWHARLVGSQTQIDQQRIAADRVFHTQIEDMSRQMDNGLMLPLNERRRRKGKQRQIAQPPSSSSNAAPASYPADSTTSPSHSTPHISQLDGVYDEEEDSKSAIKEEDDEDAINSDLDDSEDELRDEQDDAIEGVAGNTMVCTYDKVQRVKNKWKATLKDGILTVDGKEYLFHKAAGEFEW